MQKEVDVPTSVSLNLQAGRRHYYMDYERWVRTRVELIKYKNLLENYRSERLPEKIKQQYTNVNVNERNGRGEPLIVAVVKYVIEPMEQVSQHVQIK